MDDSFAKNYLQQHENPETMPNRTNRPDGPADRLGRLLAALQSKIKRRSADDPGQTAPDEAQPLPARLSRDGTDQDMLSRMDDMEINGRSVRILCQHEIWLKDRADRRKAVLSGFVVVAWLAFQAPIAALAPVIWAIWHNQMRAP